MPSESPDQLSDSGGLTGLLERLCSSKVEFILVGGLAAVAQGAPVTTFDIDIVHARDESNLKALLEFLESVNARHRGRPGGRVLKPVLADLASGGHCLLMTDLGPLDVLGRIEQGLGYTDLLEDHIEIQFRGHGLKVLKLESMIRMKRSSGRQKDIQKLPVLEETLRKLKR